MTLRAGACPNCGAPIEFRWSGAVQTVCAHCQSVVVRHDVDLEALGKVSDLPAEQLADPDRHRGPLGRRPLHRHRPHRLRTRGRRLERVAPDLWERRERVAVGRPGRVRRSRRWRRQPRCRQSRASSVGGQLLVSTAAHFTVSSITNARYRGVEGELPFVYWDKDNVPFVDLRAHDESFATIDYSEQRPLLFIGRFVEYDALALRNVRTFDERTAVDADAGIQLQELRRGRRTARLAPHAVGGLHVLRRDSRPERSDARRPAEERQAQSDRPDDPAREPRRPARPPGRGHRVPAAIDQGGRDDVRLERVRALRSVSGVSVSQRVPGPLERHPLDSCAAGRLVQDAADGERTTIGLSATSSPRPPAPSSCSESSRGASRSRIGLKSRTSWRRRSCCRGKARRVKPPGRSASTPPASRSGRRSRLPGEPPDPIGVFAHQPSPYAGKTAGYLRTFAALALALLLVCWPAAR